MNHEVKHELCVHIIGIGGIGMSGIAEILLALGYAVSGSDINESSNTKRLANMGATIFLNHSETNIKGADLLVYSAAISDSNPEMCAAKNIQLPMMRRSEIIAELMRLKKGIAIAGTHGKTTTTSLVSSILHDSGFDPTCLVGGIVRSLNSNARSGKGDYILVEADESDGAFLKYNPVYSVVTNIDDDHIDHYGSMEQIEASFLDFINNVAFFGKSILNIDDQKIKRLLSSVRKPYATISIAEQEADYVATDLQINEASTSFQVQVGKESYKAQVNLPGKHNVYNALCAFALCMEIGVPVEKILSALKNFKGVGRRFEQVFREGNKVFIDDYAHHPSEVLNCLQTARKAFKDHKVYAIFEPHRYTRTRQCWDQFLHCFNEADKAYILPIYPANEKEIPGIKADNMVRDINQLHPNLAFSAEEFSQIANDLASSNPKEKSVVICMGAGAIGREIQKWISSNEQ